MISFIRKYSSLNKKIAIISANVNKGQRKLGVELGPKYIKQEKLYYNLKNLDYETIDYIEISDLIVENEISYSNNRNFASVLKTSQKVSEAVSAAVKEGHIPLTLGGDHSVGIGTLNGTGSSTNPCAVVWIDAHADIHVPHTSASGNVHGQSVSFALKELESFLPKLKESEWLTPNLSARHLVYIGLRDVDEDEVHFMRKHNILAYSMSDIQRTGVDGIMKGLIDYLTIDGKLLPIHVSVDIDALDPWFAPSTGTPVLGGLTLSQLMHIGNKIHETGMLKALDLVEVNPLLSANQEECNRTVYSAVNTILSFFGYNTVGTLNKKKNL